MEVKLEVKMEVEMEIEMEVETDAPILLPKYMGAQSAPVYIDGKIGTSTSTFISAFISISI